jgi:hypothetical protein
MPLTGYPTVFAADSRRTSVHYNAVSGVRREEQAPYQGLLYDPVKILQLASAHCQVIKAH